MVKSVSENKINISLPETEAVMSKKKQVLLRLAQLALAVSEWTHRAINGAVAGTVGTLLVEYFLGEYDLDPRSISRTPVNSAIITAGLVLTCIAYLKTTPKINDTLAEFHPEADLHMLSRITKLKTIIKSRETKKSDYDQAIEVFRIYVEYLITASAINRSKTLKYFLMFMKYAAPLFEILLGLSSGIALNGLLVNYGILLTGNQKLLEASEQIKFVKYYCLVPGGAAALKLLIKWITPIPVKLEPGHDIETGKRMYLVKEGKVDNKNDPFGILKEIFPKLTETDLPKLRAWDWGAMMAIVAFNAIGNVGMSSWWLPILFSHSIKMKNSKMIIGAGSLVTASKEIKYFSVHALKVKSLRILASNMPCEYTNEAENLRKTPWQGIKFINFKSPNTLLGIIIGVVIASLLQTMGVSDFFPNFIGSKRMNRLELAGALTFFLICNSVIFLINSSRAATTQKITEALRNISFFDHKESNEVLVNVPAGISGPGNVTINTGGGDASDPKLTVPITDSIAAANEVAIDIKSRAPISSSRPFEDAQKNGSNEIGESPGLPRGSETDYLLSKDQSDKHIRCAIL